MRELSGSEMAVCFRPLGKGWVETLDVRAKILVSMLATIAVMIVGNVEAMSVLVLASFLYACTLRRPLVLLATYALVALMCLLALACMWLMGQAMPRLLEKFSLATMLLPFMRILVMLHVVLPLALASRIQGMMNALRSMKLPFCIYLPTVVVLRFLPTFWNDTKQILEALKMRGFRVTPLNLTLHPVLSLRLLFTPLLFRCLRSSEDLGIAAELKGLGQAEGMTPYHVPQWSRADSMLVLIAVLVFAGALTCQIILGHNASLPH